MTNLSRYLLFTFALCFASLGHAGIIGSGIDTIDGTETRSSSTRLFRDGIASTWASPKAFPGTASCGTTCFFDVLLFTPTTQFVTVTYSFDAGNASTNIFASAYLNSFSPSSLSTNYLGDGGLSVLSTSGPVSFQVIVPVGQQLALVFNNTAAGSFGSVNFTVTDTSTASSAPEPAPIGMMAAGLVIVAGLMKRKTVRANS